MNQNLLSLSHGELNWVNSLPPAFKAVRLPGSTIATTVGDFGSICIQEFTTENFSIHFKVFDLIQQFVARTIFHPTGLFAKLVVKGKAGLQFQTNPPLSLRQNQFILFQNKKIDYKETYENNIHITFDTFLSEKLTNEILPLFHGKDQDQFIKWAGTETTQLIHSILSCKYENELRKHFFESRVKDMFFQYLFLITSTGIPGMPASEDELKAVYKAEEIISEDIATHYSIPELSKKILLNEFRLKQLFKKIFGTGPYEYLVNKRLRCIRKLNYRQRQIVVSLQSARDLR